MFELFYVGKSMNRNVSYIWLGNTRILVAIVIMPIAFVLFSNQ